MDTTAAILLILAAVMAERRTLELRKDDLLSIASHKLKTRLLAEMVS